MNIADLHIMDLHVVGCSHPACFDKNLTHS